MLRIALAYYVTVSLLLMLSVTALWEIVLTLAVGEDAGDVIARTDWVALFTVCWISAILAGMAVLTVARR